MSDGEEIYVPPLRYYGGTGYIEYAVKAEGPLEADLGHFECGLKPEYEDIEVIDTSVNELLTTFDIQPEAWRDHVVAAGSRGEAGHWADKDKVREDSDAVTLGGYLHALCLKGLRMDEDLKVGGDGKIHFSLSDKVHAQVCGLGELSVDTDSTDSKALRNTRFSLDISALLFSADSILLTSIDNGVDLFNTPDN